MSGDLQHVHTLELEAPPEAVWGALTEPELTRRTYYGWRLDSPLVAGSSYAYRSDDGTVQIEGIILTQQPPWRLEMTARYLFDPHARQDPPHRVAWEIEALESAEPMERAARSPGCRVRVSADGFADETTAYKLAVNDLTAVLRAIRNLLDPSALAERQVEISQPLIRPLTPDRIDDFLRFFDHDAFADNPYWAHCYCTHFSREGTSS
jgi:uncharacterized protein YndB with AHSA1/START domain